MDKLTSYRTLIKEILTEYAQFPPSHGQIEAVLIFDEERPSYQLMHIGWDRERRVHMSAIHLRLRNNKIWIEWDGTEEGIAQRLIDAGVSKDEIVLAFLSEEKRAYTDFAVT